MVNLADEPGGAADVIRSELLRSAAGLTCVETRLALIFFDDDRAWKVNRPLLDSPVSEESLEVRRKACEFEIARGKTFAPGVYLGAVPVTRDDDMGHRFDGGGEVVDWSIHMRRLPDSDRADRRLERGELDDDGIRAAADHIAACHAAAEADSRASEFASPSAIRARIGWAFGRDGDPAHAEAASSAVQQIEAWQRSFVDEHARRFTERLASGRIRDGHGDLCLENLFIDDAGRVAIVDGAKRDLAFRLADVAADVATLSLDLSILRRVDLAERLIAEYALAADDFDLYSLIDFYESCRANFEGKTADRLYRDSSASLGLRARAEERAVRYTRAATAVARRPFLPPMLIALSGLVASGKSSVAGAIAHQIAAPVVSSDKTRDFLLSADTATSGVLHELDWGRGFRAGFRDDVYDEVFRRAEVVLESGRPVVIDGCFGTRALRARARKLAQRFETPFFFVECRAADSVIRQRLAERSRDAGLEVAAWQQIADSFRAEWEPVHELPPKEHIELDTGLSLDVNVAALGELLPVWPDELP